MDKSFQSSLEIKEFDIVDSIINIVVKITCPTDELIASPKIRVIFECGTEDRILPILGDTSYISEDKKTKVFYAKYRYQIKNLFLNKKPNQEIKIHFSVSNGDYYNETVPFTFSSSINLNYEDYKVEADCGGCYLVIKQLAKHKSESSAINKKMNRIKTIVKKIVGKLYTLFLCILGLFLLPLFFIDALMTYFDMSSGNSENGSTGLKWFLVHIRWRYSVFSKTNINILLFKVHFLKIAYQYYCWNKIIGNRVSFLSSRRMDLTGNLGFVYAALLKDSPNYDIQQLLDPKPLFRMSLKNIKKLAYLCATSKIILIDDFFPILNFVNLKEETKLIQLWHACGAFKTFGFTRVGKIGGPSQDSLNHRNYDYAIVSSQEIAKFYAEGFGIPSSHVIATGIPRTDIFFSEEHKNKVVSKFYERNPKLRDKKIILFAPTFRGNGKESAYFNENRFDPVKVYESTNKEYAIIIKHHPFVKNKLVVPEEYKEFIIDLSDKSELNDLLFVTDVIITDYSSLVFEASLLNIPMLFYAYDLGRYIAARDFYYDYEHFVPGKIVRNQSQLINALQTKDFDVNKIEAFKNRFFDYRDGNSTSRVVDLIDNIIENKH